MPSDILKSGADVLAQQMREHAATIVTYARPSVVGASVNVRATAGRTLVQEIEHESGVRIASEVRDFLITADDLILPGIGAEATPDLPAAGDTITYTEKGKTWQFRVAPAATGEPCWRWAGLHHNTLRIHTVLASVT